jgi:hypothetical protein
MRVLLSVVIACVVTGCWSSASIEKAWQAPAGGDLKNVVVMAQGDDGVLRRSTEDELAGRLRGQGLQAVPSYAVLTEKQRSDKEASVAALRQQGFDGLVAIKYLGTEETVDVYPTYDLYWDYWGGPWGGYYYYPETIVRIQADVFRLSTGQLVYSAISRSENPEDLKQLITDVTTVLTKDITTRQVVGRM